MSQSLKQKQQKQQKAHLPKPVIIELSEQQSLIKQMIKGNNNQLKFAAGYKNKEPARPQSAVKQSTKPLYRPDEDMKGKDVYNELGVSKVQPKYRVIDENNSVKLQENYSQNDLEQKIEVLRKDRQARSNLLFSPKDNYALAEQPSRQQVVTHAQSSLDVINLQNIEAKLQAHRRNLKPIEDQYNKNKNKSTPLDRYGYMKVNIDVDKQYSQLKVDQQQIYSIARKRQQMGEEEIAFEDLWEMKKRNDPKLAEYDAKYQEYLVNKDAGNLIGAAIKKSLFTWDKYTQPAHKHDKTKPLTKAGHSHSNESHHRSLSQQKSFEQKHSSPQKFGPDGLASVKDLKDVISTKDDKFIASYIFAQIDTGKVGLISKDELHDYILKQQHIINGYSIDTKWLFTDLDNFQTKRKGMFSKSQLAIFLATLEKIDHPKLTLTNSLSAQNQSHSFSEKNKVLDSSFPKNKHIFQKIFNALDFNDDQIIKREEFIQNIYVDSSCTKILDQQAIKIKVINKSITYRQIIGFILNDYRKQRNEKLKKSKEYITFTRFCQYFDMPESLDLSKFDRSMEKGAKQKSKQIEIYDLPEEYLLLLKDIFNTIPRVYQDYIVTSDFVENCLRDPQILSISDELCRIESVQTKLPLEALQTTLHRMQKQCDEYSIWEDVKPFFSRRGRPLDWNYALITQKKQIRNKKIQDSRKSLSKQKVQGAQDYFSKTDAFKNQSKEKISRAPNKYTVPRPFDIVDMKQKIDREQIIEGQKQFQQLKKKFKANPINKEILEPKPELIAGKVLSKKSEKQIKPQYKYENYQNDRIERALKKAQQKYELQQQIKAIKQKTQVKALDVAIDLTKKYKDVIKENQQKKKQSSKYKPTQPKASESLYPKNPAQEKAKKLEKVLDNMKKVDEAAKRKNDQVAQQRKKAKQKNEDARKMAEQAKKRQKQEEQRRAKIQTDGLAFKPKINKKDLSQNQKLLIQNAKRQRQRKRIEQQQLRNKLQNDRKAKILSYEKKQNKIPIEGLTDQQILQKLDQIDFEDLIFDENVKKIYRKQHNNKNKTRKQLKERQMGLAGRQRAAMQQQQRRMMEEKKVYKQKLQKQRTNPSKQNMSATSERGHKSAAFKNQLDFHKSKSLRRYRAIMDGKQPESELDRYTVYNKQDLQDAKILQIEEEKSQYQVQN